MNFLNLFQKFKDFISSLLEDLTPKIQRYFLAGLVIVVPTWFTLFVVANIFKFSDNFLGKWLAENIGARVPGMGLLVTFLGICFVGLIATNIMGRKVLEVMEEVMVKVPLVRNLYTGAKQISSIVIKGNKFVFEKVALIEYPRKGIYCIAFVTGEVGPSIQIPAAGKVLNIFLPTTPNPTSGFFLMIPEEEVVILNITPEEGIKLIISGGLVKPDSGTVGKPTP